jgi:hypothetical protein
MRRVRADRRGRWISLLVAGFAGYLLGGWHGAMPAGDLSASQNVALRFPETPADAPVVDAAADMPTGTVSTTALKQARLALLSPQPMTPIVVAPAALPQETVAALAPPEAAAAPQPEARPTAVTPPRAEPKSPPAPAAPHHASRPGFLLNDAQIARIKERLHLTAEQARMWPAVEAALRNIAYAKERFAHRHGAPANAEVASLDADSAEVQGLKSAAIPLLMSFSDEQKNEVRSLAHVMGLDKLATEF